MHNDVIHCSAQLIAVHGLIFSVLVCGAEGRCESRTTPTCGWKTSPVLTTAVQQKDLSGKIDGGRSGWG